MVHTVVMSGMQVLSSSNLCSFLGFFLGGVVICFCFFILVVTCAVGGICNL